MVSLVSSICLALLGIYDYTVGILCNVLLILLIIVYMYIKHKHILVCLGKLAFIWKCDWKCCSTGFCQHRYWRFPPPCKRMADFVSGKIFDSPDGAAVAVSWWKIQHDWPPCVFVKKILIYQTQCDSSTLTCHLRNQHLSYF